MSKKGLLFDSNGTMFFDSKKHKEAWDVLSQKYRGCPVPDYELDHIHGKTNKKIIELLLGSMRDEGGEKLSKAEETLYRECRVSDPKMFHLVDGLKDVLDDLKKLQIPMTICSASIRDSIDFFISSFHLDRWFDTDRTVYDDGTHVDKIPTFHEGARAIGVKLEDCMIIEDSLSGLDFAYRCQPGRLIAITTPGRKAVYEKIADVHTIIHDFRSFDASFFLK